MFQNRLNEGFFSIQDWESLVSQVVTRDAWLAGCSSQERRKVEENASALRVAAYWYHFSVFAADFLCLSLPLIQDHASRSYVAQTVNEELGNGVPNAVHSVLLLEAYAKAGLDTNVVLSYPTIELDQVLEPFRQQLIQSTNDYQIAGFFLGFELLAEHNISHVFECLLPCSCTPEELRQTAYFQEHFKVEPEHIRRAMTMGMKSCANEHQVKAMFDTFQHGISFWNDFWSIVHQAALEPKAFLVEPQVGSVPVLATH